MRARGVGGLKGFVALAVAAVLVAAGAAPAAARPHVAVHGAVDVRVWLDESRDIYPSFDQVVISVRAARDCYATVMVVDTDGYLHVIHPVSMLDEGWLEGGVRYRFRCGGLGLDPYGMRGIAYVFAIGSPFPFVFADYGNGIFAGHFGYRIYGDPYLACRQFYVSLLPPRCNWDWVGVSYARFYVREWVSYPAYLCLGHYGSTVHVRGDGCPGCSQLCDRYRHHVSDPYRVLRPSARYKDAYAERTPTRIAKSEGSYRRVDRAQSQPRSHQANRSTTAARIVSGKRSDIAYNNHERTVTSAAMVPKARAAASRAANAVVRAGRGAGDRQVASNASNASSVKNASKKTFERPSSAGGRRETASDAGKADTGKSYKRRVKTSD